MIHEYENLLLKTSDYLWREIADTNERNVLVFAKFDKQNCKNKQQ